MAALDFPRLRSATRWFDIRRRKLGMWAFALNRITGIGLVVYLYLHLGILFLLTRGPGGWDAFIATARSPYFLSLDVILIAGILIHGLNGVRIVLTGLSIGVKSQKLLFSLLMVAAAALLIAATVLIFGG
jgi:succinate dehydrogenase / fumarate reductase cytochrome b subunit